MISLRERFYAVVFWLGVGFVAGAWTCRNAPTPPSPPVPAPAPIPAKQHAGHFTVSYIEPRYGSPASAAVRDGLAGTDWHPLDTTFRAYTLGQDELTSLGFTSHFAPADLPLLFIQESGPAGAPIIERLKSPASAAAVLERIRELRGK